VNENQSRHVESDEFSLIDVDGNMGGCLDIKRWFSKDQLIMPPSKNYDQGIPFDVYQLLTEDFFYNPGVINYFLKNPVLVNRASEIEKIVKSRPDNVAFKDNYNEWTHLLKSVCVAREGERLTYRC
jgi:hypothetical protein